MKHWKQKMKYGVAVVTTTALPALAMANSDLSAEQLTAGITKGQTILVAVATAMFTIVGIYVAYRWGKRAAGG